MLKDGIIQQVGTPKDVYERPENIFVGGFIGSPGMNLFKGILTDSAVKIDKWILNVAEEKMKKLRTLGYVNKEIIVGIRPEDFYHEKTLLPSSENKTITVMVEVSELLGAEHISIQILMVNPSLHALILRLMYVTNLRLN